ncbi:hypothetical protein L198_03682 [Cryptococcus wingfieldii CBS 7118]|uniref:Uncharacterized protein n=1 Tax=Cryptococcus wingfieldii CBS 7118 TaxID=1295528 RepID=A0A1E3JC33_9TREE|nr:hypothetical protein L198_03682 [Cryptococcus wingfieldii CBS 7118]ODN98438.1 hypothetical protein L198_03682 [Cryptococcus wingfieldii CBS 7118]
MRPAIQLLSALALATTAAIAGDSLGNSYAGAPTDGISVYAENVSQCGTANISWTGANPPVTLEIAEGGYYIGRTSVANLTTGRNDYSTEWLVDVAAGQSLIFQVVDADGKTGYVQNINVRDSDDDSCVKFGAANSSSSAAGNGTSNGTTESSGTSGNDSATAVDSASTASSSSTSSDSESTTSPSAIEGSPSSVSSESLSTVASTSASADANSSSPSSASAQAAGSSSSSSSYGGVVAVNDSSSTNSGSSSSTSSTSSSSSASRVAIGGWSVVGAVLSAVVFL